MLERIFGDSSAQRCADALYGKAVDQARQTAFYARMGVPDTVDGRFEMIALHVFLILRRLKQGDSRANQTAQTLFDTMFTDMDRGLREMGAGDLGVGRRVKVMAKAFYGRISAYEQGVSADDAELTEAVFRNIFRGEESKRQNAVLVASYMKHQHEALSRYPLEDLLKGDVKFVSTDLGD
jgi:cytochrome b pre-mRNA-processing protein 3